MQAAPDAARSGPAWQGALRLPPPPRLARRRCGGVRRRDEPWEANSGGGSGGSGSGMEDPTAPGPVPAWPVPPCGQQAQPGPIGAWQQAPGGSEYQEDTGEGARGCSDLGCCASADAHQRTYASIQVQHTRAAGHCVLRLPEGGCHLS
jgi:hypothetical protein